MPFNINDSFLYINNIYMFHIVGEMLLLSKGCQYRFSAYHIN